MKAYFYKTTNKINGKYYYGSGSKTNYYGSGKLLKKAIEKYGLDNFEFEILREFDDRVSAFIFEERFLKIFNICEDDMSYNLTNNGNGGNRIDYEGPDGEKYKQNSSKNIIEWNKSEKCKSINSKRMFENNPMDSPESKAKATSALSKYRELHGSYWTGKNISDETKRKISETRKLKKIKAWNKGKVIPKDIECNKCGRMLTKGGFKRHSRTCSDKN